MVNQKKKQIVVESEEELVRSVRLSVIVDFFAYKRNCVFHTSWFLQWFVTNINVTGVKKKPKEVQNVKSSFEQIVKKFLKHIFGNNIFSKVF